jgi:bacteriocin-like protein
MMELNLAEGFQGLNTEELASVEGGSWVRKSYLKTTILSNMATIRAEKTSPYETNEERVTEAANNIMGAFTEMLELSRGRWNSRNR